MASFNKVILLGSLTRDPEIRYTAGGSAVTEVSLAVNRQWTDRQSNERKEEVTFVEVTLWGRTAEIAGEYLSKGRPCMIEGRLQLDQWQEKETGKNRSKLKVVGESLQLLSSSSGGDSQGPGQPKPSGGNRMQQMRGQQESRTPDASFYDDAGSDGDAPF